jgi:ketosteroid isomerase-like protein
MSDVERNKAVVRNLLDAVTRSDVAGQLAAFHEEGRIITMGDTPFSGVTDKRRMGELMGGLKEVFPQGLKMTLHNIIGEGDCIAAEAESYGRHASGKIYNNHYHFLYRFKDGLILEMKEFFDTEHSIEVLCGGQRRVSANS